MSRCVKRNSDVLKVLAMCKPPMRKAIIRAADKDLLEAITKCLLNICKDTIEISLKIMEHVKRLVLVPEHMTDTPNRPLVPPLTAQVKHLDSEMNGSLKRQDITQDEK